MGTYDGKRVAAVREAYVSGSIDEDQLEKQMAQAVLNDAIRDRRGCTRVESIRAAYAEGLIGEKELEEHLRWAVAVEEMSRPYG